MSMAWACVKNQCVQDQLDLACTCMFFQPEKHLPTQVRLPLGPWIKSSTHLLLPQFKCLTFAQGQVFREIFHVFCRLFLSSFLLMFVPETSCSDYVCRLFAKFWALYPCWAKNLNLCLAFRWGTSICWI